jgi:hypothetical protein
MSAKAPAGRASRNIGRPTAVCTRETSSGEGVIEAINQAAPTACIQPPRFDTSVASQSERNAAPRSGLHEDEGAEEPAVSSEVALMFIGTIPSFTVLGGVFARR